jgi:uncharacterized coiled-coil protein SlyX
MADERMETRIRALEERIDAQARELEKLKRQPVSPATMPGDTGKAMEAMPEYSVKVDSEAGTVE